jgi:hypothetical protein
LRNIFFSFLFILGNPAGGAVNGRDFSVRYEKSLKKVGRAYQKCGRSLIAPALFLFFPGKKMFGMMGSKWFVHHHSLRIQ